MSAYYDAEGIARLRAERGHRYVVGGQWNEIGKLQLDFLRENGLRPESRLLDIGCGCLRGGVRFIKFLNPGNYYGIDINHDLLTAGYDIELSRSDLQNKLPRSHLLCDGNFSFEEFGECFDLAIAQSLFTHLPISHIGECLRKLRPRMEKSGKLFATFFILPEDYPVRTEFDHPHGVRTFDDHDPYHYRFSQLAALCRGLAWHAALIGEWGHPRGQQMVVFE